MLRLIRSLFACLLMISATVAFTATVRAQDPWDDQTGSQEQIDRQTGQLKQKSSPGLAERIQILGTRATQKMNFLVSEVFTYFSGWVLQMAQWLSAVLILFGFLKVMRENEGRADFNLWAWFVRLGLFLSLITASPALLTDMYAIGNDIATGQSGNSVIYRFYGQMQANFEESYAKITENQFKVRVPGGGEYTVPSMDGTQLFLGVLDDQSATVRDFNNNLKDSTWTLPRLYAWLGACRTIIELSNAWLTILGGVLLMAFKILAPFMMAMAIDRQLAQRATYPFVWGAIVLTLIWPAVSYFIRGLAYMFGNVAMALGDTDPVYVWNEATLQAFRQGDSDPVYTVIFSCFTMTIAAMCLFASPVIAYQISMGRVYEGVSAAASQFAGSIIGMAIELYSSTAAALVNRQAGQIQASAAAEAETTRARGDLLSANRGAEARRRGSIGQIRGDAKTQTDQAYASAGGQLRQAWVQEHFGTSSAKNQQLLQKLQQGYGAVKEMKDTTIGTDQNLANTYSQGISEVIHTTGSALSSVSQTGRVPPLSSSNSPTPAPGVPGPGAGAGMGGGPTGTAIGVAGTAGGAVIQMGGSAYKTDAQMSAAVKAMHERLANIKDTNEAYSKTLDDYFGATEQTNRTLAKETGEAAYMTADDSAKAIRQGAAIKIGAVNQSTRMELEANQIRFDEQVRAAGITRTAAFQTADLHAQEMLIKVVGSSIASEIKNGMVLRY